jgi:pimeloyl-ACP methyl ester carboxylesterase
MLGHEKIGSGQRAVVVMHDWMCDVSSWDGARPYLDLSAFTWVFADLRGYGRSQGRSGEFTLEEAAADVLELAGTLDLRRFTIVGHSMSTLVALHLAQRFPASIERAIVLTPPPPGGFGADDATLSALASLARGDVAKRMGALRSRPGAPLSDGWYRFKAERWSACADPDAVAAYAAMFARRGLPDLATPIASPVLAVTGERDIEVMRREGVTKFLAPLCPQLTVTSLADCGHYPMQEAPPLLAAIVERFARGEG